MKRIGLTGGIGMGKSAAADLLRQKGVSLIDTDQLAREIVRPGEPALTEIATAFGSGVIGHLGELDRAELGRRVFSDPSARKLLESILHPRIRAMWQRQFDAWEQEGAPVAVVVIPLLFETRAESELDQTLCIACSSSTQLTRLTARGWSVQEIRNRVAAQWAPERKMALADFVVWNEASLQVMEDQLSLVLNSL